MRKKLIIGTGSITLVLVLVAVLVVGAGVQANSPEIDAIVSTGWLEEHLEDPDLVILDVRNPWEYAAPAGHIPGAINSPEWLWYIFIAPNGLIMELPAEEDIFANISAAGITGDSKVVIVSRTVDSDDGPAVYAIAGATRVAATLIYAGIENVAILDGGWDLWLAEGKDTTFEVPEIIPSGYEAEVNEAMFVSKDYVEQKIGTPRGFETIIVDGRDADVYFGVTVEPWAAAGHIKSATSLPIPWHWTFTDEIGTYKDAVVLGDMASGVVGMPGHFEEIIATCGVGGYASTLYFVLSEVLGYENVKIYDGAAQEWTADPEAPVVIYEWE